MCIRDRANSERYTTEELNQLADTILGSEDRLYALEYETYVMIRETLAAVSYTHLKVDVKRNHVSDFPRSFLPGKQRKYETRESISWKYGKNGLSAWWLGRTASIWTCLLYTSLKPLSVVYYKIEEVETKPRKSVAKKAEPAKKATAKKAEPAKKAAQEKKTEAVKKTRCV